MYITIERNCKTLQKIVKSNDPLEALKQNVGNKSLKEWLEIGYGKALSECISVAKDPSDVLEYLIILDAIIPAVPKFTVNKVHNIFKSSTQSNDLEQFECLISTIERDFFRIINTEKFPREIGTAVLLKVVYYAGKQTLDVDFVKWKLKRFIFNYCNSCCDYVGGTSRALLIILLEKMSEIGLQICLTPKFFILVKVIATEDNEISCHYFDYIRKLYYDLNLEERFYRKYIMLQDSVFNEQCLSTDLRCVAKLIDEDKIDGEDFILSGLLYKFHSLLCKPSEISDQTFVIKSFLTVFLSFETDIEDSYRCNNDLFYKLVRLVVKALEFFYFHNKNLGHIQVHLRTMGTVPTVIMEVLESLNVLNTSWHEWFDIGVENKIISEHCFSSTRVDAYAESKEYFKDESFANFITICPETIWTSTREKMLLNLTSKLKVPVKYFNVSRSNVLGYVFDKIRQDDEIWSYKWYFTFQDEYRSGDTTDAYSILSDELQRHYSDLCREEPYKMSDNETIHAHSPDDGKAIEEYKFLGKIMAKTILDNHHLKIPLRNEIFQRLMATKRKKYSHLRRNYCSLFQTFPQLETLFKQLLAVKRKVEIIRAEVGLSHRQKMEIISNLTFDDGNPFDDLCLNFIVPGTNVELIEGGRNLILFPHNIDLYFETLCAHTVQLQQRSEYKLKAIRDGIDEVLSPANIDLLSPEEFKSLLRRHWF